MKSVSQVILTYHPSPLVDSEWNEDSAAEEELVKRDSGLSNLPL